MNEAHILHPRTHFLRGLIFNLKLIMLKLYFSILPSTADVFRTAHHL